jgi:hypothetical protein
MDVWYLRHKQHGWLNKVESLKHIAKEYDDIYGVRTVSQIPNIHGKILNLLFFALSNTISTTEYIPGLGNVRNS